MSFSISTWFDEVQYVLETFYGRAKKILLQRFLWVMLIVISSLVVLIFWAEYADYTLGVVQQETG